MLDKVLAHRKAAETAAAAAAAANAKAAAGKQQQRPAAGQQRPAQQQQQQQAKVSGWGLSGHMCQQQQCAYRDTTFCSQTLVHHRHWSAALLCRAIFAEAVWYLLMDTDRHNSVLLLCCAVHHTVLCCSRLAMPS
jgi:hypothetical protein